MVLNLKVHSDFYSAKNNLKFLIMAQDNIYGYCLLSMPTDQVQPLGLLSFQEKGVANTTGIMIDDLFIKSETGLPFVSPDYEVSSDINKSLTMEMAVDSHLSLLEGLLKFLKLSASFKLEKNKSVKINMTDAKKNIVNEFKLDAYINGSKVNTVSPTYLEKLYASELFVVTGILKCRKYTLEYVDQHTTETGVNVGASKIGDASASLKLGNASNDSLVNDGGDDKFITLAIKAFRIFYVKDKKTGQESFRIRLDDTIKTVLDDEDFPGDLLKA